MYKVIDAGEKEDYIAYIKSLPLNPLPEAFGLHENAEITTNQNETIELLENVLSMQPRSGNAGGKSREQIINEMAQGLEKRSPPTFNLEFVSKKFPTSYEESMNTVIF